MPARMFRLAKLLVLVVSCATEAVAAQKPQAVRDLHYGEVLFHFYQEDYFTSITHLMAAQQNELLPNHAAEAELLLGGLELSYGMLNEAERQFEHALDKDTDAEVRNRVWFFLGKIAYQRGLLERAEDDLQRMGETRDKRLQAERALMLSNVRMLRGENAAAAEDLKTVRAPDELEEYVRLNRAIALLRAGDLDGGRELLVAIGKERVTGEELRALRDRANLAAGFQFLRAEQPEEAREYLGRVRLSGPFANAALLGAGWVELESGIYETALVPWLELSQRSGFDAPVQEAYLAIPYAYERMGDRARAIHFYQTAVDHFNDEQQRLDLAEHAVHSGVMLELLSQRETDGAGGWLHANPTLEDVPAAEYLVDLLAGNDFQESLKNYRDLRFLDRLLQERLDNIAIFHDMVEARRLAHEQRGPAIRARLGQEDAYVARERWRALQERLGRQVEDGDPLGLASGKQLEQWTTLERVNSGLGQLPKDRRQREMAERADWLRGILIWQLQEDYPERLWTVRKGLNELDGVIRQAEDKHERVAELLGRVESSFKGYDRRIAGLRQRLVELQPELERALALVGDELHRLALDELKARRERLVSYRSQARYALARNYDLMATEARSAP